MASSPCTTKRYYTLVGVTVAVRDSAGSGSLNYLLGDQLGSTSVAVNASTGVVATQRYLPYGGIRSSSGTLPTDRGFIGQTKDGSTGLQYLNARYYDPTIGRFTAVDPLADMSSPGSLDGYGYAGGSPVTSSDRTGLAFCLDNGACNNPIVRPPNGGPTGTERRQQCMVSCTGQALVDVIENDSSGLGDAVFGAIDVANQGNLGDLDGNWSNKDIAAAMAGGNLDAIAAQMGFRGAEADGFVALVRDVAARLHGLDDLWEGIDKDPKGGLSGFVGRNWRTWTFVAGAGACILASAGTCGGVVLAGFAARTAATVKTHGLNSGTFKTVGVDAMLSATSVATAGLTAEGGRALQLTRMSTANGVTTLTPYGAQLAPALSRPAQIAINSAVGVGDVTCAAACPTFSG